MILIPNISLAAPVHSRTIAEMSREYIEYGLGWSWTQARVLKAIDDTSTNVAVVLEAGAILGFGIMRYGEQRAHLVLLGVHLDHRMRGFGAQLLSWLEKSAVVAGLDCVQVEARADNPGAIAFYQQQGFARAGTMPGYYRGVIDAVRLEKGLRAAVGPTDS